MSHPFWCDLLLGVAVFVCVHCSLGVMIMRDAYQRMNFPAPISAVAAGAIVLAVWLNTDDPQARIKSLLVLFIVFFTNSILTHATVRAKRVRDAGHWEVKREEGITLPDGKTVVGE